MTTTAIQRRITEQDFIEVSAHEGIGIAELKTIMEVEVGKRSGHLDDGRPRILFEGHKFYKNLPNRIFSEEVAAWHPTICHKEWTKEHYRGGEAEWERMATAIQIDREAALKSASWGAFQILGENHKAAGFEKVQDFVNAMYKSERHHLIAVCKFIKSWPKMAQALRRHDWKLFARCYNGPGFSANKYDLKLAVAYAKHLKV